MPHLEAAIHSLSCFHNLVLFQIELKLLCITEFESFSFPTPIKLTYCLFTFSFGVCFEVFAIYFSYVYPENLFYLPEKAINTKKFQLPAEVGLTQIQAQKKSEYPTLKANSLNVVRLNILLSL